MKVIEYIKQYGLDSLKTEYGIKVTAYSDRMVLNYTIKSPKNNITDECRQLILSFPEYDVFGRSFDRFYNYQENKAVTFNGSQSYICEKIDGSIMSLYHDHEKWCVASRSTAFAEGKSNSGHEFKSLFESCINLSEFINYESKLNAILNEEYTNYTFIFELVSPHSRVVTRYDNTELYLLAIRNKFTGEYASFGKNIEISELLHVKQPKTIKAHTLGKVINAANSLDELQEGYVCFNYHTGQRIKVKNERYVKIARIRNNGSISHKRMCEMIFNNEHHSYLKLFNDNDAIFKDFTDAYDEMINEVLKQYRRITHITNQKDFAMCVKDSFASHVLFKLRSGKELENILTDLSVDAQYTLLKPFLSNQYI